MAEVQHCFEDADSGEEFQMEAGVTYTVVSTFVELGDKGIVFTYRVRELVSLLLSG